MTPDLVLFDLLLIGALLALASACLFSAELQRAVILFIVFGLLLTLVWARLQAPDVALAEAAIGAGLSGALLLAAARRLARRGGRPEDRP
jgi:uncharacterized MnhB-related membrane protein|nr:DUF4040 domain-containing protein [Thiococcus pfennigii]